MVRKRLWKFGVLLGINVVLLGITLGSVSAVAVLQIGSTGTRVREVQSYLHQLSYLRKAPDGNYGHLTAEAVKSFQIESGLKPDGSIGPDTFAALKEAAGGKNKGLEYTVLTEETIADIATKFSTSIALIMAKNNLSSNEVHTGQQLIIPLSDKTTKPLASRGRSGGIQAVPWSIVNNLWKNGETARIIDIQTGKSFLARRFYGYYHADVEPLTQQDTAIFREIYGGRWSWERRPVVIQIRYLLIAASVNGMPHGGQSIFDNGFKGQFCAHFLGSRIHQSGSVDPGHQANVEQAYATEWPLTFGNNGENVRDRSGLITLNR